MSDCSGSPAKCRARPETDVARCCHRRYRRHTAVPVAAAPGEPPPLGHPRVAPPLFRRRWGVRSHRRRHGFLWCVRPATDQSPAPPPPFSATSGAVRLGRGAVDHLHVIRRDGDERLKQALPKSPARPAVEPVVDGGRRTVDRWAILPAAPRFQDVDDAAQNPAIIDTPGARPITWKVRFDRCPLLIAQPELTSHDPSSIVS